MELLHHQGINQRDLAIMAGITEVSLSRYISGKRIPNCNVIKEIAINLHTTTDYILGIDVEFDYVKNYQILSSNSHILSLEQKKEIIKLLLESIK